MLQRPRYAGKLPGARSFLQTEAALADNQAPTGRLFMDPYLNCRFAPFARNDGKAMIPDGRGKNVLVRDWKSAYNFVSAGAGFTIRVGPIHPFPVRVYQAAGTGSNLQVNGTTLNSTALAVDGGMFLNPGAQAAGFASTSANTEAVVSARILTVGYRLVYTGQAASAEGLLVCDDTGVKIDSIMRPDPNPGTSVGSGTGGVLNSAANTVTTATLDITNLSQAITPTARQVTVRPENGIHGVLKMNESAKAQTFKSWYEFPLIGKTDNLAPGATWANYFASTFTTLNPAAFTLIDDSFDEANINVTAPGAYRLEVVFCMEQELQSNAPNLDMSKTSPFVDETKLLVADRFNALVTPRSFQDPLVDMPDMSTLNISRPMQRRRPRARASTRRFRQQPVQRQVQRPPGQGKSRSARRRRNKRRQRNQV